MVLRGRSQLIECVYCGRKVPVDKAIRTTVYSFSYYDPRMGLKHRGVGTTAYVCPSCARHRHIVDQRGRIRPKKR